MALVLVATLAAPLQAHPDFSGRWTLDAPSPAPADAARVLVVDQPVLRTNLRGEPIPPMYLHLSVRREGPSGTTTDAYTIGTIGGVVGGVDRNGKRIGPSAYFETVWRGDTLTFVTRRDGPDGPRTGDWSERSESWSLDSDGRLRAEIETEAHAPAADDRAALSPRVGEPKPMAGDFESSDGCEHVVDSAVSWRLLLAEGWPVLAVWFRRAFGDCQNVAAHGNVWGWYLPVTGKRRRLRRLVEVVTHASLDARGYHCPIKVDADFQDDDLARQRTVDIFEAYFDVPGFDCVFGFAAADAAKVVKGGGPTRVLRHVRGRGLMRLLGVNQH